MYNILICDDEQDIVNALKIYLSGGDYCLFEASNGREALEVVEKNDIHLILMDIMMPQLDGIAATAKLRAKRATCPSSCSRPRARAATRSLGLNIGADDYITKPFDPVEVLARVRSQLRRYTQLGSKKGRGEAERLHRRPHRARRGEKKSVTVDGDEVALTPIEFNILRLLMKNPGRIYSSAQIYELVWKEDSLGAETSVSVHIRHLRQKLEINPSEPRYLKVVGGWGIKWRTRNEGCVDTQFLDKDGRFFAGGGARAGHPHLCCVACLFLRRYGSGLLHERPLPECGRQKRRGRSATTISPWKAETMSSTRSTPRGDSYSNIRFRVTDEQDKVEFSNVSDGDTFCYSTVYVDKTFDVYLVKGLPAQDDIYWAKVFLRQGRKLGPERPGDAHPLWRDGAVPAHLPRPHGGAARGR